jgi:uncharacterized protein YprB with RNaseH-like and TPR domain
LRLTFFDIEATDLEANFGRLLCCSFLDLGNDKVETYRRDRRPWRLGRWSDNDDSRLALAIRDRLEQADIVLSWNGILYDVPFINARLGAAGERPVQVGQQYGSTHLDLMYYAGGQMIRAGGKRLDNVAKFFGCANEKTPLTPEVWSRAAAGDKAAINDVVTHCEADVRVLRDVYHHVAPHVKKISFTFSEIHKFVGEIPSRRSVRRRAAVGATVCRRGR